MQEEAVDEQKGAALESKGALDLSNKALQPVEAMMWESNIIWEDDDSDDDGWGAASASRGAKKAKRAHDTEEEEVCPHAEGTSMLIYITSFLPVFSFGAVRL